MDEKKSAIELIEAAQKKKVVKVDFNFPLDEKNILPMSLHSPDMFTIQEIQDINYRAKFAEYRKKGLHEEPIDEAAWEKDLNDQIDALKKEGAKKEAIELTVKTLKDDKPLNMAQEGAQRYSRIKTSQDILPMFLRDREGNVLFKTQDERDRFKAIISSDISLMNLLVQKYVELTTLITETTEQAKNSSRGDDSESGKPETPSQDVTDSPLGQKKSMK